MTVHAAHEPTSEPAAPRGSPWKFWGTTFWGIAVVATPMAVVAAGVFAALIWFDADLYLSDREFRQLLYSHETLLFTIIATAAVSALAVLALAVRLSSLGMREYLGLSLPHALDLKIGLAGLVLLYVSIMLASYLMGLQPSPPPVVKHYQNALSSGGLLALSAELVILAPVGEELLIRGFLLRGWAASRLGPSCAIVLTAALWAAIHTQYELYGLMYIFCLGLLLGSLRLRSGSTLLTIFLHAIENSAALIQIAIYDWLGFANA